ncbi:hypothetical protein F441_08690 [Phytophthora nicotianae CJ01A1]|uniref:Uncharacterized protein n=2 Tax=Phytophthora nicotianae TaxID=4792 RepID=W2ZBU1_PHYNI|nr:hypothetical protein F441_08690 [Phytophthora nicotianae CJ01A1]ETP44817.1 hypothetical protein F442_08650 [Phytophthora nicotianae P10297]
MIHIGGDPQNGEVLYKKKAVCCAGKAESELLGRSGRNL